MPLTAAGLLEAALSDYSCVLACEAGHVEAAYQRGSVAHKLGRLEQAIADFSRVLQLDPNHVKAAYSRAAANNQAGRFDDANGGYIAWVCSTRGICLLQVLAHKSDA
jgi:Flp pilus assembly protein TadD